MNIRVLRYFLAIAELHTVSEAAKILHVSQPTLSKQINELESELGVKLFNREYREMVLTKKGRYLQSRAKEVIRIVDKTTLELQTDNELISGELDIGAGETVGMSRILNTVSDIQNDYPGIKIHLHSGDADDVENRLANGTLDFGIIIGERKFNQYNSLKLPEVDQWGIILPVDDPLTMKETITPIDLENKPIMISEQAAEQNRFNNWWRNISNQINIIGTYNLLFNSSILVQNHSCYVLALANLIPAENNNLTFRPLDPELIEPITLIWSKNISLSASAKLFLKRINADL